MTHRKWYFLFTFVFWWEDILLCDIGCFPEYTISVYAFDFMLYCFLLCTVTLSWSYHGLQQKILDAISQCFIIRERLFYSLFTIKFQNRTFPPLCGTHSPLPLPSAAPLVCANCLSLYCFPGLLSAYLETNFLKSLLKSRIFLIQKKFFLILSQFFTH